MKDEELICHGCGYRTNAVECLDQPGVVAKKGDLLMCLNCGLLYEYQDPGWRLFPRQEAVRLSKEIRQYLDRMERARKAVITEDLAFNVNQ